jgi:hypothetical protein
MPDLNLRLTLDVSYDTNGVDKRVLITNLHEIVANAFGDGLVTGDTEAEVSGHSVTVEEEEGEL